MSDDHEIMTTVLDWFMEIEEWLPGAHTMVGDLIYGPIPLSDANNLYDLADQWGRLADVLNDAYLDVHRAAEPILDNWSGDGAAIQFAEQWFAYLEGLRQTAESAAQMQRGVQNLGLEVELMKFMALLNLIMLAVSIYMLIAAAVPTGGGSLTAAPGLFMTARLAINAAASKTVGKIASIAMRVVMRNLSKVFGRLPALAARAMPAGVRAALPRLTTAVAARVAPIVTTVTTRNAVARGARWVAARGISKAVANRMAAQAMRGVARREVYGTLAGRSTLGVQRALAREIRQQLLNKWTGRTIREGADEVITRIAEQQVARSLGREFAGYVGVRVAFGAGFMGGGNLLGQFGQVVSGNRTEGVDWGQVGVGTLQGAAFGAGMFGGPLGHAIGGGLAGGGFSLGTEIYQQIADGKGIDLGAVDWTAVGHHTAQGAAMGIIFGGQTHLENSNIGGLGMRVGRDVHVLPGADGGFNIASSRTVHGGGHENLLLTSDGFVAFEGRDTSAMPDGLQTRPDAVQAMDQHWAGRDGSTTVTEAPPPAAPPGGPRVEAPGARPEAGAPARAGGDGGGGGGGPRQNASGDGGTRGAPPSRGEGAGPSTIERVRPPAGDGAVPHDPGSPAGGRPGADGPVPHDPEVARSGGEPSRSGPDVGPPAADRSGEASPTRADGDGPPARTEPGRSADGPAPGDRSGEASPTRANGDGPPARTEPGRSADGPVPSDRPGGDRLAGGERPGGDRLPGGDRTADGDRAPAGARDRDGTDLAPSGRGDGPSGARVDVDGGAARSDVPPRDGDAVAGRPDGDGAARPERGTRDGDPAAARNDDGPPPRDPVSARPDDAATARAGDGAAARAGDGVAARADDGVAARADDGAAARADDGAPARPDAERFASAGHESGVDPSPRSIEQGTVRFREHPGFPRLEQELRDLGVVIHDRPEATFPEVIYTHVWNEKGTTLLRIEKEMVAVPDMRFIDFEHEMGHVRQFESGERFRDGPPSTAPPRREMPNGRITGINGKPSIENRVPIVEYHVRLEEVKRLIERQVDRHIIDEHLRGLDQRAEIYRENTRGQWNKNAKWAAEHFGDIPTLQRQVAELRAGLDAGPPPAHPDAPPVRSDGPESFAKRGDVEPPRPADPAPRADAPPRDGDTAAPPRDADGRPVDRSGDTSAARRDGDPAPVTRDPDAGPLRDPDAGPPRDPDSAPPRDGDAAPPRDPEGSAQRDPDAPPPDDGRMESAGHDRGEDPSPRSIEQGTVRYDEHPDFERLHQEMLDLGVTFHDLPGDQAPHVIYRHVFDADGGVLLRVEKEMHLAEGMRFIDFEHEVGHVRQMEDPARFPDGPPSTAKPVLENAEGVTRTSRDKPFLGSKGEIVEYHVRLQEVIRLIERGVDAPIVQQHLRGVDEWARIHDKRVKHAESTPARWAREHFPDIPELRARVQELRTSVDSAPLRPDGGGPPPGRPGEPGLAKDGTPPRAEDGTPPRAEDGTRDGDASHPVRGVDPARLVDVPGRVPEQPVAAPHEVAAVLNAELGALVDGRTPDAPDRPYRAEWDAEAQTMRVRFGDGLEVDVRLQVNESVPPGRSIVVRPEMEVGNGTWRQNGAAGIVLSPHVPADPVARAAHVQDALDSAFRALHGEVAERLHLPPRDPGSDGPAPRDPDQGTQETADTGGAIRPRDFGRQFEWAEAAYDRFRADSADVADIAANLADAPRADGRTGFTPAEIREIKSHLMEDAQPRTRPDGTPFSARFDADANIAEAWIRLREGRHLTEDLVLLEHELAERALMRANPEWDYTTAHREANRLHNWEQILPGRTGERYDTSWGNEPHGNSDRLSQDPGRRDSGGVSVRLPGSDGPHAGDRQGDPGGAAGGRDGGQHVRGRALEDPSVGAAGQELAGPGVVRGVEPSLRALEDAVRPDVPVRDVDSVGRHDATPVEAPSPAALTPDSVRQVMTGRNVPEQLPRWAEEHLTARSETGTPRPKSPEEIEATVRDLAEQAVDLVTPRAEVADGVRHTASPIEGTEFVPDGRSWNHPDVTVHELQQAATGVLARDFADGTVTYVAPDGWHVRAEMADGTAQHFAPYVDRGMSSLAETTMRAGTPEDPHIVRVNNRVAPDQLSRVWVHEITETLALRHAEQTRPQPHGVLRRAVAAIGRIFGGGEATQPAPRVDPHAAARMNERVHLQRLHDWAHARPEEQARLSREIAGVERDLATLGHPVEPLRSLFEPPRAPVPDGVLRGHDQSAHWREPEASRYDPEPLRQEPEPARYEPEPAPESTHDGHWNDRPWERENRPPSLDELIPLTEAEALRWGSEVQAEFAKLIETRDFAGFRVRFDPNDAHPITVNRDSVTIRMKIYGEDGAYAGHSTRVFHREHDGSLYVTHSSIQLQRNAQGHGFAREWNRFLEDYYRYSGVDYIEVHAVNRGGYAWARDDYGWAPNTEHRANDVLNRLRAGVRGIDEHIEQVGAWQRGEIALEVDPLLRRYGAEHPDQLLERMHAEREAGRQILQGARDYPFGADGYPTPYEISQAGSAGRSGSDALWVGKEALLGSDWKGIKPIGDGVVQHPRVEAPEAAVRPQHHHPHEHDLYSRDAPRTNEDVLLNGTDVPLSREAVDHVAELMGIDLGDVRVRILTHPEDVRYLDYQGAAALTPVELGGREIHLGPAAFADAETLAATVAHEYTHVRQLRDGRELDTSTLRLLEDEAYASEGPALARFRESFRGWEHVGDGAVPGRGSVRPAEPGRAPGDRPGPRGPDLDGGDPAGRGDGDGGSGAGSGVPRAGESSGEHGHPGDRPDGPDAGGDRSRPDHLARLIGGRPEDPPFRFERFYGDEHWGATSLVFEMRLGVHFFNDAGTLHAVQDAVGRLHETIVDLATRGIPDGPLRAEVARQAEEVFFRSDVDAHTSAGQVGHGVPLKTLLEQGNVRELMTAFYNAAYFNRTNMHTLANTLIRLIDTGRVADVDLPAGIDRTELAAVWNHLDRSLIRNLGRAEEFLQTRFGIESQHRFARDIAATGGVVMRSSHPYRDMLEVVNSQAGRRVRSEEEQLLLATTAAHYERLGTPLGRFERAFVESITGRLDPDTPLPWREGFVWHDTGDSRWAQSLRKDGLVVLDGISATTTRMLTAAKLIGLHGAAAERFLHGLIGWMLPARDHSLFEMLRGASIAGVEPVAVHPIRPSAVELYRNVPGVDLPTIRAEVAPDGLLPHEARYQARALDPNGFTETQHKVQEIADRLWPQFESGRVTDPELAAWLDRNGIDSQDPAAVRALTERFTKPHLLALSVYTRHSHYLINTAITARMSTLGLSDGAVGAIHGRRINSLIDNYLLKLADGAKPLPLPLALRPVLHEGPGHLDSNSTLRPEAREWIEATRDHARALAEQNRAVQAGDVAAARAAKADVKLLARLADETRRMMLDEAAQVAPRLFDEVRWHADMVYDALMQLPTVGTAEHPVIAYRGDWIQPVHSPIYGSRMMPDGVALSVLSTSRLPEVAVRFMEENPASDRKVIAVYRLTGVNARDISVFSSFAPDQEVVLPPGSRTRQVGDPELVAGTRELLPPKWRDRVRVIVLEERE